MERKNQPVSRIERPSFDELSAAEVFLQVVRAQSFTAAAKALDRSPSTLSRTVAELERHVGAPLLNRTTRRMHLTEAGALYAAHAEGLLVARRAAHDAIAELSGGVPRGQLRVTLPVAVGERLLAPALPELRRRYPALRLLLDLSDRNVELVQSGYDLAIRVGRLADSTLRAQRLGKVPVLFVASPSYLRAHGEPKSPADIRRHPAITVAAQPGAVEWAFHHRHDRRVARIEVEGTVHTTSPSLAAQIACGGLGVLRVVEWVVREDLRRGDLVEIMRDWACNDPASGGMPVHVVYAQTASATPPLKSRVFVEFVKEIMAREVLPKRSAAGRTASAGPRAGRTR